MWAALSEIPDPEIPVISLVDLGVIKSVVVTGDRARVELTPTFMGCPALDAMTRAIGDAVAGLGAEAEVVVVVDDSWSTDRISAAGREKLRAAGFRPATASLGRCGDIAPAGAWDPPLPVVRLERDAAGEPLRPDAVPFDPLLRLLPPAVRAVQDAVAARSPAGDPALRQRCRYALADGPARSPGADEVVRLRPGAGRGQLRDRRGDHRAAGLERRRQDDLAEALHGAASTRTRHRRGARPGPARVARVPDADRVRAGARLPAGGRVSAAEFLAYMAEVSGLPRTAARLRASDMLRHVGLFEERYRPMGTYSTGMKQRVKLAQALVHDPVLAFLDEPTAGLDPIGPTRHARADPARRPRVRHQHRHLDAPDGRRRARVRLGRRARRRPSAAHRRGVRPDRGDRGVRVDLVEGAAALQRGAATRAGSRRGSTATG